MEFNEDLGIELHWSPSYTLLIIPLTSSFLITILCK